MPRANNIRKRLTNSASCLCSFLLIKDPFKIEGFVCTNEVDQESQLFAHPAQVILNGVPAVRAQEVKRQAHDVLAIEKSGTQNMKTDSNFLQRAYI